MLFPPIGLFNKYYLGDTVMLEPIADAIAELFGVATYVISDYPEVYDNHPRVTGIARGSHNAPADLRIIKMSEAITPWLLQDGELVLAEERIKRLYKKAGLPYSTRRAPKIYLSDTEKDTVRRMRRLYKDICLGVVLESRHAIKTWPHVKTLLHGLRQYANIDLFVFAKKSKPQFKYLRRLPVHSVVGLPLREAMMYLSLMDVVIGPDTGFMHVAGALDIPIVVTGLAVFEELFSLYPKVHYIASKGRTTRSISARRVVKHAVDLIDAQPLPALRQRHAPDAIAVVLLEGLGGTVSLSDHAKKIVAATNVQPHVVIRKYKELLIDNPYIENVRCVGMVDLDTCLREVVDDFGTVVAIKTGLAHCLQDKHNYFNQDFARWEKLYKQLPLGTKALEQYGLNFIQTANMSLGLPYDTIESSVYKYGDKPDMLPEQYIVVSNGVDVWHKGLIQTKSWPQEYWQDLVEKVPLPVVQVGTEFDAPIPGSIDIRGKTTILDLLAVLRDAALVVCQEGGIMHLSYAVHNDNVVVMCGPTQGVFFAYPGQTRVTARVCGPCYWDTPQWYATCPQHIGAVCMRSISPERVLYHVEKRLYADMAKNAQFSSVQLEYRMASANKSVSC